MPPVSDEASDVGGALPTSETQEVTTLRRQLAESAAALARLEVEHAQLIYAVSHDLQEPLRMVASFTALLERDHADTLGDDGRTYLSFAHDGAKRMQRMLTGLLEYSRAGTRPLDPAAVPLTTLFERARNAVAPAASACGARITWDQDLPVVLADADAAAEIVRRLLDNSLRYRGEDPPVVHIHVTVREIDAIIEVSDNGCGFSERDAGRIFQIYQQLQDRAPDAGSGTGLAISRTLARRMGGTLVAGPKPQVGARLRLTLPLSS